VKKNQLFHDPVEPRKKGMRLEKGGARLTREKTQKNAAPREGGDFRIWGKGRCYSENNKELLQTSPEDHPREKKGEGTWFPAREGGAIPLRQVGGRFGLKKKGEGRESVGIGFPSIPEGGFLWFKCPFSGGEAREPAFPKLTEKKKGGGKRGGPRPHQTHLSKDEEKREMVWF